MNKTEEIFNEAKECLNCKNPMCKKGCPVHTNIPEFINKIKENNIKEAYEILQENNILSEICSLICPTENQCMEKCVKGIKGKPVSISKLELFVNRCARENNLSFEKKSEKSNGKKIAIIGAGPSGIACAVELQKRGYVVTIFEKNSKIGGILEYEIPDFRLPKTYVTEIGNRIKKLGIKVKCNTSFGKDISFDSLKKDGYEAVFLGIGANVPSIYKITKEECKSIFIAKDILNMYYNKELNRKLGKTIVIGGGNVALDAARVAKKLDSEKVTIVYRRTKELMPAIKSEIKIAEEEGINFIFNTRVIFAKLNKNKEIEEVECTKTKIVDGKAVDEEGSDFNIKADTVIFAIGSKIDEDFFKTTGIKTEDGLVVTDEYGMTNVNKVFAGGDLTLVKPSVCKAIATGKKAAEGIDRYIKTITYKYN